MNLLRHQVSAYNIVVLLALITIFGGSIKPILGQEIRDDEPAIIRHDDGVPDPQCLSSSEEWLVAATVPSNFSKSRDSVHWACFSPTGAELVTIDDTKVGLEQCCKAFYHVMQMQLMVRVDNGRMHVLTGKLCWKPNQCSSHTKDFFTFLAYCKQQSAIVTQVDPERDAVISLMVVSDRMSITSSASHNHSGNDLPRKQLVAHISSTNNEGADTTIQWHENVTNPLRIPDAAVRDGHDRGDDRIIATGRLSTWYELPASGKSEYIIGCIKGVVHPLNISQDWLQAEEAKRWSIGSGQADESSSLSSSSSLPLWIHLRIQMFLPPNISLMPISTCGSHNNSHTPCGILVHSAGTAYSGQQVHVLRVSLMDPSVTELHFAIDLVGPERNYPPPPFLRAPILDDALSLRETYHRNADFSSWPQHFLVLGSGERNDRQLGEL